MGRMNTFEPFLFLHEYKYYQDNKHVEEYYEAHVSGIKQKILFSILFFEKKDYPRPNSKNLNRVAEPAITGSD